MAKKMGGTDHGSGTALTHVKEACCSRINSIGFYRNNIRVFDKKRATHTLPRMNRPISMDDTGVGMFGIPKIIISYTLEMSNLSTPRDRLLAPKKTSPVLQLVRFFIGFCE